MRMTRILTGLVAFALLGLTPLALTAPANAARAEALRVAAARPAAPAGRALPTRDLHDRIVQPSRHKLIFKGRVDPGHGPVVIQKKACRACKWHRYQVVTTDDDSRWRVRIYAPRHGYWFWRGFVKAYGGYAKSWTDVWRTYTV